MAWYSSNGQFGSGYSNPRFGGNQGSTMPSFPQKPYSGMPRWQIDKREEDRRRKELEKLRYQQSKKGLEESIYGRPDEPLTEAQKWEKRLAEKQAMDSYMNYGRENPMMTWFKSFMERSQNGPNGQAPGNPQPPSWDEPSPSRLPPPYREGGGQGGGGMRNLYGGRYQGGPGGVPQSGGVQSSNGWTTIPPGGGGGGGGYQQQSQGWTPDMAQGVPKSSVDPMDVIRSAKPLLEREAEQGMAAAAHRFGQSGAPIQSGYAEKLGEAQQNALDRLNNVYLNTLSQSAEAQAGREQQAQQSGLDRSLSAWGTQGGWDNAQDMARKQRGFDAWSQQGQWQYGADQNRLGRAYDAWGQQGQWGQQNADRSLQSWLAQDSENRSQMEMMMQLLSGFGG